MFTHDELMQPVAPIRVPEGEWVAPAEAEGQRPKLFDGTLAAPPADENGDCNTPNIVTS